MKLNNIKVITIIMIFIVVNIILLCPVSRAETESFTLSAKKDTIDIGEAIEVELNVTKGMEKQNQLGIIIRYDSSKLKIIPDEIDTEGNEYLLEDKSLYKDITDTDDGIAIGFVDDEDETVSLVYYTDSAERFLKTSDKLADLKFIAINSGTAKISFDIIEYAYENEEPTEIKSNSELSIKINKNNRYLDVSESDWFYNEVEYVSANNLMNGYTSGEDAGKFGPYDSITRGQIVTILYRMEGQPAVFGSLNFVDKDDSSLWSSSYYNNAILWASQKGIVTGYKDGEDSGKFLPDKEITREEFAIILQRCAKIKGASTNDSNSLTGFYDYELVSPWAKSGLEWAVAKGIITGDKITTPPSLKPQGNATRAESAIMIMRFCEKVK